jgi:D-glycero-D-manno-heptose 1,7-bisphosphate phosphatase
VQLHQAGKTLVVATNQSGIARGYLDQAELEKMHHKLSQDMQAKHAAIEAFYYCPHGPDDGCDCRKPAPGMVLSALKDFNCKPENALLIGDSIRDLLAAYNAGVDSILVKTGKGSKASARLKEEAGFFKGPVCDHLAAAVQLLLQ